MMEEDVQGYLETLVYMMSPRELSLLLMYWIASPTGLIGGSVSWWPSTSWVKHMYLNSVPIPGLPLYKGVQEDNSKLQQVRTLPPRAL